MKIEEIFIKRGYTIDKNGDVYNPNGIKLKQYNTKWYKKVGMRVDGKKIGIKVHRLQAYMKFGNKIYEEGIVVRHLNNNRFDNSWDNIEIGTCHDNMMDNPKEMRMKYAINASKTANKYGKEFVEKIRNERKTGMKYSEIMEKYNLSKSTVSYIINHNYIIH